MTQRPPLELSEFDTKQRELEKSLVDPLASCTAAHIATGYLEYHGKTCRRAIASGGDLRRTAEQGRARIRRHLLQTLLPAIDGYFGTLGERLSRDQGAPASLEDLRPRDVADLLRSLADWERTVTTDTEVTGLISKVCSRMAADARTRVDQLKAEQSPEDSPDFRAVAAMLAAFEEMIALATRLDRQTAAQEIGQQRDHAAKSALLAGLAVLDRAENNADMFVHFDVAAMLVSFENVVVVIARTAELVDQELDDTPPYIESTSENIIRAFAAGLKRVVPSYRRMLKNSIATPDRAVPQFVLSVVRVLVQIARLMRLLTRLLGDESLDGLADRIAKQIAGSQGPLRKISCHDPSLLSRMEQALADVDSGRIQRSPPAGTQAAGG
jgi:hypothetical protein